DRVVGGRARAVVGQPRVAALADQVVDPRGAGVGARREVEHGEHLALVRLRAGHAWQRRHVGAVGEVVQAVADLQVGGRDRGAGGGGDGGLGGGLGRGARGGGGGGGDRAARGGARDRHHDQEDE